jgi:hypothetical protein
VAKSKSQDDRFLSEQKGEEMKQLRLRMAIVMSGVLTLVGLVAFLHPQHATADSPFNGASYVTTITDSSGNFASRGVITLHTDHTLSVIDSGQGGPAFLFSSQLGSWEPNSKGGVAAKTIDFDFPSAGIARLDYTINSNHDGSVSGTITLTSFPLQGNPLGGGGTVVGTFTFTGQPI